MSETPPEDLVYTSDGRFITRRQADVRYGYKGPRYSDVERRLPQPERKQYKKKGAYRSH